MKSQVYQISKSLIRFCAVLAVLLVVFVVVFVGIQVHRDELKRQFDQNLTTQQEMQSIERQIYELVVFDREVELTGEVGSEVDAREVLNIIAKHYTNSPALRKWLKRGDLLDLWGDPYIITISTNDSGLKVINVSSRHVESIE